MARRNAAESRDNSESNSAGAWDLSGEERVELEQQLTELRRNWPRLERGEEMGDDWWAQIGLLLSRAYRYGPDAIDEALTHLSETRNERE